MSVVFSTQNARGVLPLSPCEKRAGRESERGGIDKKRLLSPALSSFFEEERERKCGCALKANLLPNTTDGLSRHDRLEKRITGDEPSPPLILVLLESSVSTRFVCMECITVNE